jgi:hypothetical protein
MTLFLAKISVRNSSRQDACPSKKTPLYNPIFRIKIKRSRFRTVGSVLITAGHTKGKRTAHLMLFIAVHMINTVKQKHLGITRVSKTIYTSVLWKLGYIVVCNT